MAGAEFASRRTAAATGGRRRACFAPGPAVRARPLAPTDDHHGVKWSRLTSEDAGADGGPRTTPTSPGRRGYDPRNQRRGGGGGRARAPLSADAETADSSANVQQSPPSRHLPWATRGHAGPDNWSWQCRARAAVAARRRQLQLRLELAGGTNARQFAVELPIPGGDPRQLQAISSRSRCCAISRSIRCAAAGRHGAKEPRNLGTSRSTSSA